MKILFSSDWHIKLGQKNVPKEWQRNRFNMLVQELNKAYVQHDCDLHIVGGDILDRFDPTAEELELYFELISQLEHPTEIFSGNHEMVNKSHSVLLNVAAETVRCNPLVEVVGTLSNKEGNFDILDYSDLHKKPKNFSEQRVCFTHVRGEILPHVKPEVDLSIFDAYALVVAGDLHSHQNTQATQAGTPIVYPGSPLTTSFHRQRTKNTNGYLVVDTECKTYEWYDLGHLPQLIRKTIPADRLELMVPDRYDRVIYEVEGDLTELKSVKNSELLDKKVNKNVGRKATLNLSKNEGITKELVLYLTKVQNLPETRVKILVSKFKDLVPDAN